MAWPLARVKVGILVTFALVAVGSAAMAKTDSESLPVGLVFLLLIATARLSAIGYHADIGTALLGTTCYAFLELPWAVGSTSALVAATLTFAATVAAVRFLESATTQSRQREIQSRNMMDDLTIYDASSALLKQRYGLQALEDEVLRARRTNTFLSLVLLALDAPAEDDPVAVTVDEEDEAGIIGAVLGETLRATDRGVRIASATFAGILPATDAGGAAIAAEKLRRAADGRATRPLRCGIATFPENAVSAGELLEEAQAALELARLSNAPLMAPDMLG
ncbi:MAG: hypothetical protein DLM70_14425 [Chloroflexi bacterium]|nr:MAG: hypothetical protein DLM70_14425 [Chloroflexota bacterium]